MTIFAYQALSFFRLKLVPPLVSWATPYTVVTNGTTAGVSGVRVVSTCNREAAWYACHAAGWLGGKYYKCGTLCSSNGICVVTSIVVDSVTVAVVIALTNDGGAVVVGTASATAIIVFVSAIVVCASFVIDGVVTPGSYSFRSRDGRWKGVYRPSITGGFSRVP